jgi:hypothetical protein
MNLPMSFERRDVGRASIPVSLSENFCLYSADMYTVVESGQFTVGLKQPYFCPKFNCQTQIHFSISGVKVRTNSSIYSTISCDNQLPGISQNASRQAL